LSKLVYTFFKYPIFFFFIQNVGNIHAVFVFCITLYKKSQLFQAQKSLPLIRNKPLKNL